MEFGLGVISMDDLVVTFRTLCFLVGWPQIFALLLIDISVGQILVPMHMKITTDTVAVAVVSKSPKLF